MGREKNHMEILDSQGFEDIDGSICLAHIHDEALSKTLAPQSRDDKCRICNSRGTVIDLNSLMVEVMEAVQFLYESPENAGVPWDPDDGWMGAVVEDSDQVVIDVCFKTFTPDVEYDVLDLLASSIALAEWTENRHGSSLDAAQWAWEQFVSDVKTESRFVFLPDSSFEGISSPGQRSAGFLWSLLPYVDNPELSLLVDVPKGTAFYRGRLIHDPFDKTASAKKLGPAPADNAAANRMSPEGVPMFYGSGAPETAIREIGAHGVGGYARIGAFRNQRELTLLDLTTLPVLPSVFDKDERENHGVVRFFSHFAKNLTAPIRPDGRPHVEYVPTQVITEFFRWVPSRKIDGIKLRSAQDGEDTYVLFFGQEHVDDEKPENTQTKIQEEDAFGFGFEPEPPVLTLNPSEVHTYRIIRHIDAEII
jgi:hypothetical protein